MNTRHCPQCGAELLRTEKNTRPFATISYQCPDCSYEQTKIDAHDEEAEAAYRWRDPDACTHKEYTNTGGPWSHTVRCTNCGATGEWGRIGNDAFAQRGRLYWR